MRCCARDISSTSLTAEDAKNNALTVSAATFTDGKLPRLAVSDSGASAAFVWAKAPQESEI